MLYLYMAGYSHILLFYFAISQVHKAEPKLCNRSYAVKLMHIFNISIKEFVPDNQHDFHRMTYSDRLFI